MQQLTAEPTTTEEPRKRPALPTARFRAWRDSYGALEPSWSVPGGHTKCNLPAGYANRTTLGRAWVAVQKILAELEAGDVDEHRAPAWETGAEFDKHGRGEAVNISVYGVAIVAGQALGIVQVRQWSKSRKRQEWARLRKNYFLVGRNEGTRRAFAHPIPSRVVHAAINRDSDAASPVTAARAWIFEVPAAKLATILRHGDVAAIPVKKLPAGERQVIAGSPAGTRLIDSHVLQAEELIEINDRLYARDPLIQHLRGQHADVRAEGWHRIQIGLRADFWKFARPTAD